MAYRFSSRTLGTPDYWILILAFGLALFGIAMISSASALVAFSNKLPNHFYLVQQLIALGVSAVVFFVCATVPFRLWRRWSVILLLISIIGLIAVFIPGFGAEYGTARSWIIVPVLGSFQPVEFTKLALIIYLSSWIAGRENIIGTFKEGFIPFAILLASNLILIALQPDFGSILVIIMIATTMYFVGGANVLHIFGGGAVAVFLSSFIIMSKSYIKRRFLTFLNPDLDPEGVGYHIKQILIAIGSGGWWGLGFGRSRQKYHYLPEPQADSIFAVTAEELGFVRVLLLIAAISALVWRGFRVALGTADRFGMLLAVGITTWIAGQTILNIAVNVAMAPMTGVPMPFISHGGSSLMMLMAGCGILFNISREARIGEQRLGRSLTATKIKSQIHQLQKRLARIRIRKL
ncbi:MAG: putative peptidoglycan glycosyltransferase FtsW [Patescibacteria group bacterium]|nr:putative peptidoglycan glycosyltransferase FtsW [Patescibacteria group bacterium]